jgi:hypothetical protein
MSRHGKWISDAPISGIGDIVTGRSPLETSKLEVSGERDRLSPTTITRRERNYVPINFAQESNVVQRKITVLCDGATSAERKVLVPRSTHICAWASQDRPLLILYASLSILFIQVLSGLFVGHAEPSSMIQRIYKMCCRNCYTAMRSEAAVGMYTRVAITVRCRERR